MATLSRANPTNWSFIPCARAFQIACNTAAVSTTRGTAARVTLQLSSITVRDDEAVV
jgi:hypothetical protein